MMSIYAAPYLVFSEANNVQAKRASGASKASEPRILGVWIACQMEIGPGVCTDHC